MKRVILSAIALLCVISCTKVIEPTIVPPQSEGQLTIEVGSDSPLLVMAEDGQSGDIALKSRGAELAIDVVTNGESWSCESDGADWLMVESCEYFVSLVASRNEGSTNRTATLVIRASKGEVTKSVEIKVSQNSAVVPEVSLVANNLHFEAHTSLVADVAVESNSEEWDVETTCSWLLVEKTESGLTLTADDNRENLQREATVVVRAGEDSDRLVVKQDGNAYVVLSSHNVATDNQGATKTIRVECNPELQWGVTTDGSGWFTARAVEGAVEVTIAPNGDNGQRVGAITVRVGNENNSATATLRVHQIGSDTEELIYEIETTTADFFYTAAPVLTSSTGGAITVDWGDGGEVETFEARRATHTYAEPGKYTITISGSAKSLEFGTENSLSSELKSIISWGKLGYTTAVDMCLGCSKLESIPNDVAGSFAGVKSFLGAFSCCESLREIPAGLFRYATVARNFEDCFSHTASIAEIPQGLFDTCTAAEDFSYTFYGTGTGYVVTNTTLSNFDEIAAMVSVGKLRAIPVGLFDKCTAIKQMDYIFGATAITEIPETIFDSCANATTLMGAFSACVNLTNIPQSLLARTTSVTDIKYMFAGCRSVTELPVGMFVGCSSVTNLEYIFYRTGVKALKKGLFEGLVKVKTIGAVFQGCQSLTDIEEGVFDGLNAVTSFKYCFSDCTALTTLPAGLFAGRTTAYDFTYTFENTAITSVPAELFADVRDYSSADLSYTFAQCKNLKTVPASLFEKFTAVTSPGFKNTFNASGIETIPQGLFSKNVKVSTGFEETFYNCTSLKRIEGPIFPQSTTVTSLAYTFCGCTALETLPAGMFDSLAGSKTKFTGTFVDCTALKSLPENLFANNTTATQFTSTFAGCTALKAVPETLLGANEKATTVKGLFDGCTALETIPANIFASTPAITSFERTFADCTALTAIPESLFSAIGTKTTSVTFSECFTGCSAITAIPASLFDTVRRINYIDRCFENCTALTGESPYTVIGEQRVHLYERTRGDDFLIIPSSSSAHEDCFAGCTGLTDYSSMPSSWR